VVACILLFVGVAQSFGQTVVQISSDVRFVESKEGNESAERIDANQIFNANIFVSKQLNDRFAFSCFALTTEGWGEFHAGIDGKVTKHLTLGVHAGLETIAPYWRFAGSATYFRNDFSALFFLEKGSGKENSWYSFTATEKYEKCLNPIDLIPGIMIKKFYGAGPSFGFGYKDFTLTLAPLYELETMSFQPAIFMAWKL